MSFYRPSQDFLKGFKRKAFEMPAKGFRRPLKGL